LIVGEEAIEWRRSDGNWTTVMGCAKGIAFGRRLYKIDCGGWVQRFDGEEWS
jgi:hypothetical protein